MNAPIRSVRIGTRGSPLALAQARMVADALRSAVPALTPPDALDIVVIKTTGDIVQDRPLSEIGGKGLFTKEIDQAMMDHRIDLAVHSMKDVPTRLPDGIVLAAMLPREDPRDVLILGPELADAARDEADPLAVLPLGARVGTASLRRQAQLLAMRPDLQVAPMRGNVGTRIGKLDRGDADVTLLALAGLRRLGIAPRGMVTLPEAAMLPAVAQGAVGLTARAEDAVSLAFAVTLNDPATSTCVAVERGFLAALEGDCRTPIAGLATLMPDGGTVFEGLLATTDGRQVARRRWQATPQRDGTDDGQAPGAAEPAGHAAFGQECGHALMAESAR